MDQSYDEKKDKIILKNVAVATADSIVAAIDNSMYGGAPVFGIAWGLSKGLYGAGIQIRQDRAIEFVEMIRDNPKIFTRDILSSEEFQDGFVHTFQKYLSERIKEKRKIIKNIFLGFSKEENKDSFKLERYLNTLEQLSIEDIEVIKTFSDKTVDQWYKDQFPEMEDHEVERRSEVGLNVGQIGDLLLNKIKGLKEFEDHNYTLEVLTRLSGLGLVLNITDTTFNTDGPGFKESRFGKEFISYVFE